MTIHKWAGGDCALQFCSMRKYEEALWKQYVLALNSTDSVQERDELLASSAVARGIEGGGSGEPFAFRESFAMAGVHGAPAASAKELRDISAEQFPPRRRKARAEQQREQCPNFDIVRWCS